MPRIFTPPDYEFDRSIPKVLIRNCTWTETELQNIVEQLSDARYDIYIYNNEMNDIQWFEGIRSSCIKVIDFRDYKNIDSIEWLRNLDDVIK